MQVLQSNSLENLLVLFLCWCCSQVAIFDRKIRLHMVRDIRPFLIEQARQKKTVTYDVMNQTLELGLNFKNRYDSKQVGDWLDEISEHEVLKGRPMLSSLVIRQNDKRQGDGFYTLYARLRGGSPTAIKKNKKLEENEQQECFAFWSDDDNYSRYKSDF